MVDILLGLRAMEDIGGTIQSHMDTEPGLTTHSEVMARLGETTQVLRAHLKDELVTTVAGVADPSYIEGKQLSSSMKYKLLTMGKKQGLAQLRIPNISLARSEVYSTSVEVTTDISRSCLLDYLRSCRKHS